MKTFFYLEGAYLILGGFILLVTLFVTTRPFVSKSAPKKGLTGVGVVLAIMIGTHYYVTMGRMAEVKQAFEANRVILCESRMQRKVSQVVHIKKENEWRIDGDHFVSPYYERPFFLARCIVE